MRSLRVLLGAALSALLCSVWPAVASSQERVRSHFDFDKPFSKPGFFDFVVLTGDGKADWMIVPDPEHNPPSPPNQTTQIETARPAGSLTAAIRRTYSLKDGTVSVALKRQEGIAGLLLRMTGEQDYLLVLLSSDGTLEATSTQQGASRSLAKGRAEPTREWNVLSVELSGASLKALVNGTQILQATDPAPAAGRAGLATRGPGAASFDEFVIEIKE